MDSKQQPLRTRLRAFSADVDECSRAIHSSSDGESVLEPLTFDEGTSVAPALELTFGRSKGTARSTGRTHRFVLVITGGPTSDGEEASYAAIASKCELDLSIVFIESPLGQSRPIGPASSLNCAHANHSMTNRR